MKIRAMRGCVLVDDIKRGDRIVGSIILPNDDGKTAGVRPRWAHVYSVGSDIKEVGPGDWILLKHGNWTRGLDIIDEITGERTEIWAVNWPDGALAVSDEPEGITFSSHAQPEDLHKPRDI